MTYMVIGLGSMGKRRIRLLKKYLGEINLVGIDLNADRLNEVKEQFGIKTFESVEEAMAQSKIIGALVCTSPITH